MYATATDLVSRFGADELLVLSVAREHQQLVSLELFKATVAEDDRSVWTAEERAAADLALARMIDALIDARNDIDLYVGTRYPLPLSAPAAIDTLRRVACDLARYRLYDEVPSDAVLKRYDDAVKLLEQVASGKIHLASDVQPGAATTGARWTVGPPWERRGHRDY